MHFPRGNDARSTTLAPSSTNNKNCVPALVNGDDCESDVVDECAIPSFVDNRRSELPTCSNKTLSLIIQDNQDLFRTALGLTSLACHCIPTSAILDASSTSTDICSLSQ